MYDILDVTEVECTWRGEYTTIWPWTGRDNHMMTLVEGFDLIHDGGYSRIYGPVYSDALREMSMVGVEYWEPP